MGVNSQQCGLLYINSQRLEKNPLSKCQMLISAPSFNVKLKSQNDIYCAHWKYQMCNILLCIKALKKNKKKNKKKTPS